MTTRPLSNHHATARAFPSGVDDLGAALMRSGLVPFVVVDSGNIVASSPALRELLGGGYPYHHIDGHSLASIVDEADRPAVADFCDALLRGGNRAELRCALAQASGGLLPAALTGTSIAVEGGPQLVLMVTDLTPWVGTPAGAGELADAFDAATGFARRALLLDRMRIALAAARRHRRRAAVLRITLEKFDALLGTLVRDAAEEVEATVAETLRNCVRDCDTIARLGVHEFVLLLSEIAERDDAGVSAARVVAAIAGLFERNDPARRVRAHIGVSVYPADGTNPARLLHAADAALQVARALPGGGFALADASIAELTTIEPLEFLEEYVVGVPQLDEEHRALVARTNAVVQNLKAGVAATELARDVEDIAALLRAHLAHEAHHLGTSPYDGHIDLRTRNLRFLDELDCILRHVNAQSILLAARHLHDWLAPHLRHPEIKRAS